MPASVRVVTADFREGRDRRFVTFHGKRARGLMARWVVEHRIENSADLRNFDTDGYRFAAEASTPDHLLFVRDAE